MPTPHRKLFWLVIILFPIAVLVAGEIALRWGGYGENLDLVVRKGILGKEYYTLNPVVARRYFVQKDIALPEPHDDLFAISKPAGTKRIFLLGESTMAGFPYDYTPTPSSLLRCRLEAMLPQYHYEVIDAALSAVCSYTVLDFARELRAYQPDAYVVYLGHNEFYGALGVASTESRGTFRSLVKLSLTLQKSRLFLFLRDLVGRVKSAFVHGSASLRDESLMEAMVGAQAIPYDSDEYRRARENFEANLRELVSLCRESGIPLILTTMTSNIRDQKPFEPVFAAAAPRDSITALLSQAARDRADSLPNQASALCRHAVALDPTYAPSHYLAAQAAEDLGIYQAAKAEYRLARDFDGLRFRASTEFNDVIRRTAANGAFLADADSAFDANSPHGIVGSSLMLEHLHPNYRGYSLLARLYADCLRANGILASPGEWHMLDSTAERQLSAASGVTDLDLEAGNYRIAALTSRWPFRPTKTASPFQKPATMAQEYALRLVRKEINWSQAHYTLGDKLRALGDNGKAIDEYRAVAVAQPYYYFPLMMIGDGYRAEANDSLALVYYRAALEIQNSPFLHVRLGMLHYDKGALDDAIREFHLVFAVEQNSPEQLQRADRALAYYFLGVCYGKEGNLIEARENIRMASQIDPLNKDIQALKTQLRIQ